MTFQDINTRIASRLGTLRHERGWSIGHLAARSGVSRAMISKIERANTSPTLAVLNKLSIGFGMTLSDFLGSGRYNQSRQQRENPVSTREKQQEWSDPLSGCRRITLTPPDATHSMQLAAIVLPAGSELVLGHPFCESVVQRQIWVLKGRLDLRIGVDWRHLRAGDCIAITVDGVLTHRNPAKIEARYLIALAPTVVSAAHQ